MWTIPLTITLLAILAASSASPVPSDVIEENSDVVFLSHPDGAAVVFRNDNGEVGQWNDLVVLDEPRHLEKRSPLIPPFDPISKKLKLKLIKKTLKKKLLKKKAKKFAIKLKPFKKPALKKGLKVAVPTALASGPAGLAGFALTSSLPALPALPALGAAGAGAPFAASSLPFIPQIQIPSFGGQSNRNQDRRRGRGKRSPFFPNLIQNVFPNFIPALDNFERNNRGGFLEPFIEIERDFFGI